MIFFEKIRMRLAKRRLIRALNSASVADLRRAAALQRWLDSTRLVPGDKILITLSELYGVDVVDADTLTNPQIKEWKEFEKKD